MSYPDCATFARHLGPGWTLAAEDGRTVAGELLSAEPLAAGAGSGGSAGFSLVFRVAAGGDVGQGTYAFSHEALDRMQVFVVPIGTDEHGLQLQAIFT